MNKQPKKNRYIIIIIIAVSVMPFVFAWYLVTERSWDGQGINNGELITPPIPTTTSEFIGFDSFSVANIKEIKGHWVLINIVAHKECNTSCQQAIHNTQQLRLMMSKELIRIRRLVLIFADTDKALAKQWWQNDLRLLRAKPSPSLSQKLHKIRQANVPDGMLFLMDPFGNLMMQYEPNFNPYHVKSDLKRLLKISQIG